MRTEEKKEYIGALTLHKTTALGDFFVFLFQNQEKQHRFTLFFFFFLKICLATATLGFLLALVHWEPPQANLFRESWDYYNCSMTH